MIKRNRLKKPVSVLLSVLMLFSLFVPASAADETFISNAIGTEVSTRSQVPQFNDGASYSQDVSVLEDLVDMDEFSQYLIDSFYDCPENGVDISQFGIPYSSDNSTAIFRLIWNEIPELFHIYSLGCSYNSSSKIITSIYCGSYSYTADEYHEMYEKSEKAANEMVADLVNSGLSDVEKALLIHDRMVAFCEYDYDNYLASSIPTTSRNIYGVLVLGDAVCQGYSMAYEYLLRKVGIEAHYMSSDALNHAWNNVYIDGAWYYVDATWDDPVWDVNGRVKHTNFLQSYEKFSVNHSKNGETDYEILEPANSTYDEFYWTDVNAAFQYLDGNYYYIDVSGNALKKTSDLTDSSKSESLLSFGKWTINSSGTYYINTYAKLSNDGQSLLYSLQDGVYRYNITTGTSEAVWKPTAPSGMSNPCVYGFDYDGGYLTCVYNSTPNFDADTKNLYTQKKLYDIKAPYGEITSTNDVAQSQTVTLTLSDNVEVDGYYWGSNADYTKNTYTQISSESVEKTVSQAGTYYLTVKDTSGNLSETVSITMLQTTLDANAGSVTPAYVLTESGKSFVLPSAERSGYNHLGWALGSDSAVTYEAGESYTPSKNASLTSIWSCKHEQYNSEVTTAATCSAEGVMTYTCTTCGDTYTEPVEKLPHTVVTDKAVAATCTTEGKTEGSHCSVCGVVLVAQETIAATNHSYTESVTKEATCTEKGVMTHICSKCGDTYTTDIAIIPHTAVTDKAIAATCTTDGKTEGSHCSVCGVVLVAQETIAATNHSYTESVTKEATCTEKGVMTHICSKCGDTYTTDIAIIPHTVVTDAAVAATCTTDGKTEGSHCSVCGTVLVAQTPIAATNHSYTESITKEATCAEKGVVTHICSKCGDTYTTDIDMIPHTVVTDAAVAATCTTEGKTEGSHCSVCGVVITAQKTVPVKEHTFGEGVVTTAATCSKEGVMTYSCTVCGGTKTEPIAKAPHTIVTDAAVAATCTTEGKTEGSHCSVCGVVITAQKTVPVKEHTFGEGVVTTAATCSKEGVMTYSCTVCGSTKTKPIAKTPHTIVTDAAVAATCTTEGKTEGSHCSVCGVVITAQKTVPVKEHTFGEGVVTTAATCSKEGVMTYSCTVCGSTKTEPIAKTPHTVVTDAAVAATCTTEGKTEGSHCSVCGVVITAQKTVPVKAHTFGEGVVVTPATCTNEGVQVMTCTVCGQSQTQNIPLAAHSDSDGDGVCDECGSTLEDPSKNCSCICHKTGFAGFIYKIIRIFWKLFGIKKTCECGINHY